MFRLPTSLMVVSMLTVCACQPMEMVKNFGGNIVVNVKGDKPVVTQVKVQNDQLIITGSHLEEVDLAKIEGDTIHTFTIESKSSNQLVLNAKSALALIANKSMNLIISNAQGAATFPISFELQNGQVTSPKLHHMGASNGQFLQFNGTSWVPGSISTSQVFAGGYDAATDTPDITASGGATGTYYIVTVAGTQNLGAGNVSLDVGDWVIYNGTTWDRLAVGTNTVSRFNNRTGLVVPMNGDYSWSMLDKTAGKLTGSKVQEISDVDIAGIQDGDILQWNQATSKWEVIPLPSLSLSAGSVTSTHIANGSIDSTKISDGSIVNADISATAAIDQTKINGLAASFTAKQDFITAGTNTQYWRGDKSWQTLNTAAVAESTNLYFTEPRVLGTDLTGYAATTGAITSSDTILSAIQKLSGNLGTAVATQGNYVLKGGDTMSGPLAMGNNKITGLADPTVNGDAANKLYVDTKFNGVSSSQWTTSSSDISYITGKVGVGTANPTSAFHVSSSTYPPARIERTTTNTINRNATALFIATTSADMADGFGSHIDFSIRDDAGVDNNIGAIGTMRSGADNSGGMYFMTSNAGSMNQRMRIDPAGNVGINTTTPTEKLDVVGNMALTGKVRLKSNTVNYVELQAPTGLASTLVLNFPGTAGSSGQALTTDGSGNLSWTTISSVGANSVGSNEISDGSIMNADISATAAIDQTKINGLAASFTAKQDFITAGTNLQYWRGDKSWQTLNTSVVPEGTNEYFTGPRVLATLMSGYATGSALTVNVTDTVSQAIGKLEGQIAANKTAFDSSGVWSKNTTNVFYNGGNVGIGTNTPGTALQVNGTVSSVATATGSLSATQIGIDGSIGAFPIMSIRNQSSTGVSGIVYNDHANNGKGFIGHINSGATAPYPAGSLSIMGVGTPVTLGVDGTELMRVSSSTGYIGIGTTNPQVRLEVDGSIRGSRATDNSTSRNVSLQVSTDTYNAGNGFANGDLSLALDGGANSGVNALRLFGVGARTLNLDITDGSLFVADKVGIGTTNPIFPLEIKSTGSFQARVHAVGQVSGVMMKSENSAATVRNRSWSIINSNEYGSVSRTGLEFVQYSDNDNDDVLCEAGEICNTHMAINTNGNVGIGTNNPTAKLHITGTAGADGIKFPDNTVQTSSAVGPVFSVTNGATASTTSIGKITFTNEQFDPDNVFDTSTSRLQPGRAGYYQVNYSVTIAMTGIAGFTLSGVLYKNGSAYLGSNALINYTNSFSHTLNVNTIVYFNGTTDYVEGYYGTNGGTASIAGAAISGHWLRP